MEGNRKAPSLMKVSWQCPLVLTINVVWRESRILESEELEAMGSEEGKSLRSE
jgi:hypothetical protein